jgi:cbb3-type cytochrome oxidase subunit 3
MNSLIEPGKYDFTINDSYRLSRLSTLETYEFQMNLFWNILFFIIVVGIIIFFISGLWANFKRSRKEEIDSEINELFRTLEIINDCIFAEIAWTGGNADIIKRRYLEDLKNTYYALVSYKKIIIKKDRRMIEVLNRAKKYIDEYDV